MSWHCWVCGSQTAPGSSKLFVRLIVREDFHPRKPLRYKPRVLVSGVIHADCLLMIMEYGQRKRLTDGWVDDFRWLRDYIKDREEGE